MPKHARFLWRETEPNHDISLPAPCVDPQIPLSLNAQFHVRPRVGAWARDTSLVAFQAVWRRMERPQTTQPGEVTLLLRMFRGGDAEAASRLMALIYPELRRIAQAQFRRERAGHDLQPTALVHEAFLRLVAHEHHTWENRGRFFAAAANVMRRILIEHARARSAQKRDAAQTRATARAWLRTG